MPLLSFFRLLRWPNLLIIVLTQILVRFGVLKPFLYGTEAAGMTPVIDFLALVTLTVCIAAGGYVINDYFDVVPDEQNKPGKNAVGREIRKKSVMNLYMVLTGLGIVIGAFLAFRLNSLTFGLIIPFIAGLLWFYSERYKKMLIRGNLIVSLLSALVILLVWYTEFLHLRMHPALFSRLLFGMKDANSLVLFYAGFAFLCSLIREIVKDAEDAGGDREAGCNTLPISVGLEKTKGIVTLLILTAMVLLGYAQYLFYLRGYFEVFWYLLAAVQFPFGYLVLKLRNARTNDDFHFLSQLCKMIMVAGILSIQLLSFTL